MGHRSVAAGLSRPLPALEQRKDRSNHLSLTRTAAYQVVRQGSCKRLFFFNTKKRPLYGIYEAVGALFHN